MGLRFPKVDFFSDDWPIRTFHETEQRDWYFAASPADFFGKDIAYCDALRCLVAEMVIAGKPKIISAPVYSYRQLANHSPYRLFDIKHGDLDRLEESLLACAKKNPRVENKMRGHLVSLSQLLNQLSRNHVLPVLGWKARATTMAELTKIKNTENSSQA